MGANCIDPVPGLCSMSDQAGSGATPANPSMAFVVNSVPLSLTTIQGSHLLPAIRASSRGVGAIP